MKATQTLPEGYVAVKRLDLTSNMRALALLNLAGFLLLVPAGWLFLRALLWLRPAEAGRGFDIHVEGSWQALVAVLWFLGIYAVLIVSHEAVHGVFFWMITRSRPAFGFKGLYAYACAPGWYISRNPYLVVSLAPLVVLSVAGVALFSVVPSGWLLPLLALLALNVGGAAGDMYVGAWLLTRPATCLAQDMGDVFFLFEKKATSRG